jgi:hypothetical protein
MTTVEAIALGAMLAWTPSLVFLAWALWRTPLPNDRDEMGRDG